MFDRAYFLQRFKNPETANAAYESYKICGEGRHARQVTCVQLPQLTPWQAQQERYKRRALKALALRREGFTYASIGRILCISHDRVSGAVRRALKLEEEGYKVPPARIKNIG